MRLLFAYAFSFTFDGIVWLVGLQTSRSCSRVGGCLNTKSYISMMCVRTVFCSNKKYYDERSLCAADKNRMQKVLKIKFHRKLCCAALDNIPAPPMLSGTIGEYTGLACVGWVVVLWVAMFHRLNETERPRIRILNKASHTHKIIGT